MMSSLLPIPFPSPKCSSLEPALRGGGGGVGGGGGLTALISYKSIS